MGVARPLRLATKAFIPQWHESLFQIGIRRFQVLRSHSSQSLHQPVLGGFERALNAPLGLRRMGRDPLDVQLLQRPSDLAQLLLGGVSVMDRAGRNLKQAGLVGVYWDRPPML